MTNAEQDILFMKEALREARKALKRGDVPVGAVIAHEGGIISRGHNRKELVFDPSAHAEVQAIRGAAKGLRRWRLSGTTLYVTLEPCLMCMGAIIQARVPRLVFGASDPKAGACGSIYDVSADKRLNHAVSVSPGVLATESSEMLKEFFRALRAGKRGAKAQ